MLRIVFSSALAALLLASSLSSSEVDREWRSKVDPRLLASSETDFIIWLEEQADLRGAHALDTKLEKGTFVFETLTATAEKAQRPLLRELERRGLPYRSYWIANLVWTRGNPSDIEALARRSEVRYLHANPVVSLDPPAPADPVDSPSAIEWGIQKIEADRYWSLGFTGEGVVIGGQDTGYDWDHPALRDQYRGWNGASADHNYSWHDAIHSGGGVCGANSPEPCDDHSHGTHTMGTMVGDDGGANQIGVAPGAKWIGCRNMDQGNGTTVTYIECWQWFVAPTDLGGANPDPARAPHVINNSWSCPVSEGCTDPNVMLTVVENVRAAGIVPVVSAGNSGSSCSTVNTPAAIYDASFTIGSTTSTDAISGFSSRGPVTVDGSGRLKPDVSAPGSSVRSSIPGGGYSTFSGTSMAAPHVAGQIALLISGNPDRAGDVDTLEECIRRSAVPKTSTQSCGGLPGNDVPNHTFGWGRVELPELEPPAPSSLTAIAAGDNCISLSWAAIEGPASYGVFRAEGACPGGDYAHVASGVSGTSFVDTSASGGVEYSYLVRASSVVGACYSSASNCDSAMTTGGEILFVDDFEIGDLVRWSARVP